MTGIHTEISEVSIRIVLYCIVTQCFWARSQTCKKRLLVASCLSVCQHETTRLPLDGFSWNL